MKDKHKKPFAAIGAFAGVLAVILAAYSLHTTTEYFSLYAQDDARDALYSQNSAQSVLGTAILAETAARQSISASDRYSGAGREASADSVDSTESIDSIKNLDSSKTSFPVADVSAQEKIEAPALSKPKITISSEECGKSRMPVMTTIKDSQTIIPTSCVNIGTRASIWDISIGEVINLAVNEEEVVQIRCDTIPSSGFGTILSNKLVRHQEGSNQCRQKK